MPWPNLATARDAPELDCKRGSGFEVNTGLATSALDPRMSVHQSGVTQLEKISHNKLYEQQQSNCPAFVQSAGQTPTRHAVPSTSSHFTAAAVCILIRVALGHETPTLC